MVLFNRIIERDVKWCTACELNYRGGRQISEIPVANVFTLSYVMEMVYEIFQISLPGVSFLISLKIQGCSAEYKMKENEHPCKRLYNYDLQNEKFLLNLEKMRSIDETVLQAASIIILNLEAMLPFVQFVSWIRSINKRIYYLESKIAKIYSEINLHPVPSN